MTKVIGVREAKAGLSGVLEQSQGERVIIARHGKPVAVVIGVEGEDLETVMLENDTALRTELEARRRGKLVSSEEARRRLGLPAGGRRPPAAAKGGKKARKRTSAE